MRNSLYTSFILEKKLSSLTAFTVLSEEFCGSVKYKIFNVERD